MSTLFLDRDVELEALNDQLASVRAGSGAVVVIEGPAGIGKSSLAAAVTRSAQAAGVATMTARGGPLEQDAVWGISRQLFEPLRAQGEWDELATGAAGLAALALDPVAPEPALAEDAVHAAVHGLVWLASNLAERGPALLVVDDVHWADAASLRWLATLGRRIDELPLGVLCVVRTGEPAGSPDLLAELLATAPRPSVRPRPLGLSAVEAIVAARLPSAEAGFVRAAQAVTAGNPFLLRALLAHVENEGIAPDEATAARLASFGPDQVARAVERQLARLPDGAGPLATALAVLGTAVPLAQAARLAGRSVEEAEDLADALRSAGLVVAEGDLALAHPLISSTLYAGLGPAARARMHAEAATVLAEEGVPPERVALHLLRTEPQGDPGVVALLMAATAAALARGAPESAIGFLQRAAAEPPPDRGATAAVRVQLGLAMATTWRVEAAEVLEDSISLAASPSQRADHALRGARALGMAGYFEEALALCRRGLVDGPAVPEGQRARLEAELVCVGTLRAETRGEMAERVRGWTRPEGLMVADVALESMLAGRPATETDALLAPLLADGVLQADADSIVPTAATIAMIVQDNLTGALSWCDWLGDIARPRGWLVALAHVSWLRSMALVRGGRIRLADPDARLALQYKLGNTPLGGLLWAVHTAVDVLVESDRTEEAEAVLRQAGVESDVPGGALAGPLLLQSRARLRLAQGRPEAAYADAVEAGRRCEELAVRHPAYGSWRVEAAAALTSLGDRDRAAALAREHLDLAERLGTPAPRAAGLVALAQAGGADACVDLLEQAATLSADSPAALEHVRVLVALGAALRRGSRTAEARDRLRTALDLSDEHGMHLLARRARDELVATGARPRRPATTGPDSLTPSELRVATLAATGHSNRDIAGELFVTRRTVETHLTHAFAKLGIDSRAHLSDALTSGRSDEVA